MKSLIQTLKKLSFLLLVLILLINSFLLIGILVIPYFHSKDIWLFDIAKFGFPFLFIFNIGLGLLFYLKRNVLFALSLCVYLMTIPLGRKVIALNFNKDAHLKKKVYCSILTANVMGFDWLDEVKSTNKILVNLTKNNPDIICLQEYLNGPLENEQIKNHFIKSNNYQYFKENYVTPLKNGRYCYGQAIYSKYPIVHYESIKFKNSWANGAFYADVVINKKDTIRIVNVHLESFKIKSDELTPINPSSKPIKSKLYITLHKLKRGYIRKEYQVNLIKKVIDNCPYPTFICGDFNDNALGRSYQELIQHHQDAWLSYATGVGSTLTEKIPLMRIDYQLFPEGFKVMAAHLQDSYGSDHKPLMVKYYK